MPEHETKRKTITISIPEDREQFIRDILLAVQHEPDGALCCIVGLTWWTGKQRTALALNFPVGHGGIHLADAADGHGFLAGFLIGSFAASSNEMAQQMPPHAQHALRARVNTKMLEGQSFAISNYEATREGGEQGAEHGG